MAILPLFLSISLGSLFLPAPPAPTSDEKYLEDYRFIVDTVAAKGAAVEVRGIDWEREAARLRPLFAACTSDRDHIVNVMRLLAILGDAHTGVTRSAVDWVELPSKWDGVYGGGMWLGWDRGRIVVRGLMPGHVLGSKVPAGSVLLTIEGTPAWLALEKERARIRDHFGTSSDHSLFASMGNRLIPFGEKQKVAATFLLPDGTTTDVEIPRWGPGGKAYSLFAGTTPPGVEYEKGAVSTMLEPPWSKKVGYLRITGSMNDETVTAFHRAFDALEGMEVLLLDCRGMGGGSDSAAWAMAGRLYPGGVDNGLHGRIEATGSWQFAGPVVMVQDSIEVSSAETFTWAVSETGRVISVGRATGGWGIIPRGFQCPSGLVDFRLGVNHRPTPIRRVHTEGLGWPPDIEVPWGPHGLKRGDADRQIAMGILQVMHAGVPTDRARALFQGLFAGECEGFAKAIDKLDIDGFDGALWAAGVKADIEAELGMELARLSRTDAPPEVRGSLERGERLVERAKNAGLKNGAKALEKAMKALRKEAEAQAYLRELRLLSVVEPPSAEVWRAFLKKHKKTRTAQWLAEQDLVGKSVVGKSGVRE